MKNKARKGVETNGGCFRLVILDTFYTEGQGIRDVEKERSFRDLKVELCKQREQLLQSPWGCDKHGE